MAMARTGRYKIVHPFAIAMPLQPTPVIATLLRPIRTIIEKLLPSFAETALRDPQVRAALVQSVDAELTRQVPVARFVPPATRQAIIRKTLDMIIDDILLNTDLAPLSNGTGIDGFILTAAPLPGSASRSTVETAVANVFGAGWSVMPTALGADTFRAAGPSTALTASEAWEAVHNLEKQPGITNVEIDMLSPVPAEQPPQMTFGAAFGASAQLPGTADCEWSLKVVHAREAWAYSQAQGRTPHGRGIVVGHPDTGYTRHVENWNSDPQLNRLRYRDGYDVWDNDDDATDPLDSSWSAIFAGSFVGNPGHGTGTSSIIFSDDGPFGQDHVTGTAPEAQLIPFRTAPSVVVFKQWKLAEAIRRATDKGSHVISISMGGLPWPSLEDAVKYAVSRGVIVCCAAGNEVKFVVWPAAYDETVACAACNVNLGTWSGSSRGKDVDITAPGEDVWHAESDPGVNPQTKVSRGSGTSYAVATVAGIAASWLAHHGRDALVQRYGLGQISAVFKHVLARHACTRPAGWDTANYGPGIIHAEELLKTPLPDPAALITLGAAAPESHSEKIGKLFEDVDRTTLRTGLSKLLAVPEAHLNDRLEQVGNELLFHFYSDAEMRQNFRASMGAGGPMAFAAAAPAAAVPALSPVQSQLAFSASPSLAASLRR